MKRFNTLLLLMLTFAIGSIQAQRYLTPQFEDVTVVQDIEYSQNITVITGAPGLDTLVFDLYTPTGDTEVERPVVIIWETGNFLPNPLNGSTLGTNADFTPIEVATRLAKLGYVAVIPTYRKGWNPVGDLDTRISTLINASYRGIQDSRAMVRFLRKSVDDGNEYGICPERITQWGIGTGGYITMGSATIDAYEDLVIDKFIGPDVNGDGIPDPYVLLPVSGDPDGLIEAPLNLVNTPGYSSEFALCVNMGGALGDLSWLDEDDIPMIAFHTPADPFAPYATDILTVPTTGDLIVEVSGSFDCLRRVNELGLNDAFATVTGDPYTEAAALTAANPFNSLTDTIATGPEGLQGLMPFNRPEWTNPLNGNPAPESDPWAAWNAAFWSTVPHPSCPEGVPVEQCNFHVISSINNQDMTYEKANIYLDSIMGYFAPRAFVALDLEAVTCVSSTENLVDASAIQFTAVPNPAVSEVTLSVSEDMKMEAVTLYNLNGSVVATYNNVDSNTLRIARNGLANGVYLAKVRVADGVATQKIIFN